jgi:hypothetical protein
MLRPLSRRRSCSRLFARKSCADAGAATTVTAMTVSASLRMFLSSTEWVDVR